MILFPMIALLTGVLLQLLLGRFLSQKAKGWLAFLSGLAALVGVAWLLPAVTRQGALDLTLAQWDQGIALAYRVDGLSMVFNLMAAGIGTAILVYCIPYMAHEPQGTTRFYALMLTFIAGLIHLVCSANLLMAYFSWEVIGLCSYFLVGFWYQKTEATQGARKVLVITHLAGYAFLIAILLLYGRSGTFLWTDPALQASFSTGIFLLLLLAAMAKSVMFPLHTWIPEAMNAPTPVSALLHSACYVKAGVYLVARMYSITGWQPAWNTILLVLGAVTMLVGAAFALAQTDMKRLLAYSTISQLGHILTALGLGTSLGVAAGIFYCLSHGLFKGTLFLCAGAVQHSTGTRDMRRLGGLSTRMPFTAALWLVAAAAIVGVPLMNGFVAKWLLLDSALDAGSGAIVLIAWLVSILTAFYMLKATVSVFYGDMPAELAKQPIHDAEPGMKIGMGVLGGLCLLFGVAPQILFNGVVQPAVGAMGFTNVLQASWFGVHTGTAGVSVTAGALILLAALAIGLVVYVVSRPRQVVLVGAFTGGDPLPVPGQSLGTGDFTDMVEEAVAPFYAATDPDPLYLRIWQAILALANGLNRFSQRLESRALLVSALLAVAAAILVWLR